MSYYKYPDAPSYIVLFSYSIENVFDEESAIKSLKKIIIRCKAFAKAIDIHFHDDMFFFDEEYHNASTRLIFNIKEPKDSILLKMPCLFNFAACIKLTFVNQSYYSKSISDNS